MEKKLRPILQTRHHHVGGNLIDVFKKENTCLADIEFDEGEYFVVHSIKKIVLGNEAKNIMML